MKIEERRYTQVAILGCAEKQDAEGTQELKARAAELQTAGIRFLLVDIAHLTLESAVASKFAHEVAALSKGAFQVFLTGSFKLAGAYPNLVAGLRACRHPEASALVEQEQLQEKKQKLVAQKAEVFGRFTAAGYEREKAFAVVRENRLLRSQLRVFTLQLERRMARIQSLQGVPPDDAKLKELKSSFAATQAELRKRGVLP